MSGPIAFVVAACAAGGVWTALIRWSSRQPPSGGRPGRTIAVGLVLTPVTVLVGYIGAAVIEVTNCSYEGFFESAVDCSPARTPLTVAWLTICCCGLAVMLRAVYLSGGTRGSGPA